MATATKLTGKHAAVLAAVQGGAETSSEIAFILGYYDGRQIGSRTIASLVTAGHLRRLKSGKLRVTAAGAKLLK